MPSRPLVSVCIPSYERAEMLPDAIASALGQVHVDLEVVVADNASDDGTREVVEEFTRQDGRVRLQVNDTNLGASANLQASLRMARGNYVKFLMSDDVLRPDALARMVPHLEDPKVKLVSSRLHFVDAALGPVEQPPWTVPPVPSDARVGGVMFGDHCFVSAKNFAHCPSNVMFRRSDMLPEDLAHFSGVFWPGSGDFATWLSLMARGDIVYLVDPVADLRLHEGQGSADAKNAPLLHLEWLYLLAMSTGYGFLSDPNARRIALVQALRNLITYVDLSSASLWGRDALNGLAFGVQLLAATTVNCPVERLDEPENLELTVLLRNLEAYRQGRVARPLHSS